MRSRNIVLSACFLVICCWAASAAWAKAPRYTVTEFEPLETAVGTMPTISGWSINNAGQVVGQARIPGRFQRAAFLYSPGEGMKDLDPDGTYVSRAEEINDQGWVNGTFGSDFSSKPFLFHEDSGFDLLEKNSEEVKGFIVGLWDMNASGVVVGGAHIPLCRIKICAKPVLYSREDGWIDLSGLHPIFRENSGVARLINNVGDLVLTASPAGGFQESFILVAGEELVDLGHFGTPVNVPSGINDSHLMSGISRTVGSGPTVQKDGPDHAYFFTPESGVVDLHPPRRYKSSAGMGVTSAGVIVGQLQKDSPVDYVSDTMFTFDPKRNKKVRFLAKRKHFKKMFPTGTDFTYLNIGETYFNEGLEFVGTIWAPLTSDGAEENSPHRFFFLSKKTGLLDLQDLLDETGFEAELVTVIDINDLGQILVDVRLPRKAGQDGGQIQSVILTSAGSG